VTNRGREKLRDSEPENKQYREWNEVILIKRETDRERETELRESVNDEVNIFLFHSNL
jgi:hypothetical protein